MSMVPYEAFLPEVLPYVRDCPEFVAINAIRNACIEFCGQSLIVREVLPSIEIVAGQAEYALDIPLGSSVKSIIAAGIGLMKLHPNAEEQIALIFGSDWRTREGPVQFVMQDEPDTIRLVMVPTDAYDEPLNLTVALQPMRSSKTVQKIVYERWAETIGFGARARLHDTPGQPYADMEAASKYRRWFETGIGKAKIEANRALGRTNLVVRPPTV